MPKVKIVKVLAVSGPTVQLCYASPSLDGTQGNPMRHCDRAKGHGGMHTWEFVNALNAIKCQGSDHVE